MKKIKFLRFGGLSPVIQKGYTIDVAKRGYHTPPARKGFYAFVYPYFEFFLLGGDYSSLENKNIHAKFEYLKDKDGNKIKLYETDTENFSDAEINPELKKFLKKGKSGNFNRKSYEGEISDKFWTLPIFDSNKNVVNSYVIKKKNARIFTHTGEIWHHLKNKAIKPFEIIDEISGDWVKTDYDTFVRALDRDKIDNINYFKKQYKSMDIDLNKKNIYNFIDKDHLEVFIERLKNV